MQNMNSSTNKTHRTNCGNAGGMSEAAAGCPESVMENSARHERLYKAATVAAALLLLAGAAAA